jgi:hypothetical protein
MTRAATGADPAAGSDIAYFARLQRPDGRPFLVIAGVHAIGSLGAGAYLSDTEHVRNNWVTIKPLSCGFATSGNGPSAGLTIAWCRWPLDGMQGVRGSNPLSSTHMETAGQPGCGSSFRGCRLRRVLRRSSTTGSRRAASGASEEGTSSRAGCGPALATACLRSSRSRVRVAPRAPAHPPENDAQPMRLAACLDRA